MARFTTIENLALEASGDAIRLLRGVGGPMKPVGDQGIRAAGSVALQTAEGLARSGRDRAHRLRGAYAELKETLAVLTLLSRSGDIDARTAEGVMLRLDRLGGMLWRRLM